MNKQVQHYEGENILKIYLDNIKRHFHTLSTHVHAVVTGCVHGKLCEEWKKIKKFKIIQTPPTFTPPHN